MLAKVYSSAVIGLEGVLVEVEVDIAQGLPSFTIVGLGDTAVQESRERGARRRAQLRLFVPDEADYGQPGASRPAESRSRL